jgi:hypothetical protein
MPLEIQTALISAAVAIITVAIGGFLTWNQIQRERRRWLTDLKTAYSMELHKTRLDSYPRVYEIFKKLSTFADRTDPVTPEKAKQIAQELNDWFYSVGGMCAEATTRGVLLGLREACAAWGETGEKPSDLDDWRFNAMLLLRLDLDIEGLESFDLNNRGSMLAKVKEQISQLNKSF